MMNVLNPLLTLTELNVTSTGASKDNVEGITDDEYGLAILQSDVLTYAHEGTNVFTAPETDALWVAGLYNETVQITAKGGITSVDQLKGKAVCVGDQGSGTEFNAYQVLEAYGMTADDIEVVHANFGEASEMLKNGQIDAAFTVAGAPTTAITELATSGMDFSLVSLDQEHVDILRNKYPFLVQENLPAGTYEGVDTETICVAVEAALVLKHAHWNVTGPNFIAVHEMLDPEVEAVLAQADETAERIATLGGTPDGRADAIVRNRTWKSFDAEGRVGTEEYLKALIEYYDAFIADDRKAIAELDELDVISSNIIQDHVQELEKFQWFMRSHLA